MKTFRIISALLLFFVLLSGAASAAQPNFSRKKELYDTKADGKEQIKKALAKTEKENKNVLLKFGANWCVWCHSLSDTFKDNKDVAKVLKQNFILVLIDVDKDHNKDVVAQYGNPTEKGLPVLVVLDKTGKQLHTQETEPLEEGKTHSPAKVIEFLNKWKPAPVEKGKAK